MTSPADMLEQWYAAETDDAQQEAGIQLLVWVDDRCQGLVEIDSLLRTADLMRLPTPVLLDMLSSTKILHGLLPSRHAFVVCCRTVLIDRLGEERAMQLLRHRA